MRFQTVGAGETWAIWFFLSPTRTVSVSVIDQSGAAVALSSSTTVEDLPGTYRFLSSQLAANPATKTDLLVVATDDRGNADAVTLSVGGYVDAIDASVSTRATQAQILSDAVPFAGANVDVAISSRSDFDELANPVELLDTGGVAGTSAAELVSDVDVSLSLAHGAGSWLGVSASDWTAAEREQMRDALGIDGAKTAATGGDVQDIRDDAAELNDGKITVARAANLDEITALRMAELDAANMPADVDALGIAVALVLSTGGAGPWTATAGSGLTAAQAAQLLYLWTFAGGDPANLMTMLRAAPGSPGRTSSADLLVDQTVVQIDNSSSTYEQQ